MIQETEIKYYTVDALLSEEMIAQLYSEDDITRRAIITAQMAVRAKQLNVEAEFKSVINAANKADKQLANEYSRDYAKQHQSIPLAIDGKGNAMVTISNFLLVMRNDDYYANVRYNQLLDAPEIVENGISRRWVDADESASKNYIEQKYHIHNEAKHKDALSILMKEREYHPVRIIIDAIKWDGVDRIEKFLCKWLRCEDSSYTRECSRLIFAGGINRLYHPGCKFEDVVVLIGTHQGEGKSTLIRWMALNDRYYRTAFIHKLQGTPLSDVEQRALAAADVPGTIPTQTLELVMKKLVQVAPLVGEINLMHFPGNVTFTVEAGNGEATLHTENGAITPSDDKTVEVSLTGFEIVKLISISAKTAKMTINAFETWLVDNLTESIGYKVEKYLAVGTGSNEPQGIAYANTWVDDTNGIVWASSSLTVADITEGIALLPGAYDANAKFYMKKTTFWKNVMPLRDEAKAPIVTYANGKYYIFGYEVKMSDYFTAGVIFLGDAKKIYGNFAQDPEFASSDISGFRSNSTDYRGACLFDSKVGLGEAFVKIAAAM